MSRVFPDLFFEETNFEDFQKSEMIQNESIEDGFLYTLIWTERNDTQIILKSTITQIQ